MQIAPFLLALLFMWLPSLLTALGYELPEGAMHPVPLLFFAGLGFILYYVLELLYDLQECIWCPGSSEFDEEADRGAWMDPVDEEYSPGDMMRAEEGTAGTIMADGHRRDAYVAPSLSWFELMCLKYLSAEAPPPPGTEIMVFEHNGDALVRMITQGESPPVAYTDEADVKETDVKLVKVEAEA